MSVLLSVAIVTAGVSFCVTSLGYMGIKFAKWSTENEDAAEKREREEQRLILEREKALEEQPKRHLVEEEKKKKEEEQQQYRKTVVAEIAKQIANSSPMSNAGELDMCPFCRRESGQIVVKNDKPVVQTGMRATGVIVWQRYVNACVESKTGEGPLNFIVAETSKKYGNTRYSGPSGAITFNVDDKVYTIQLCLGCGGWWRIAYTK